jgi:hypothetical protein
MTARALIGSDRDQKISGTFDRISKSIVSTCQLDERIAITTMRRSVNGSLGVDSTGEKIASHILVSVMDKAPLNDSRWPVKNEKVLYATIELN